MKASVIKEMTTEEVRDHLAEEVAAYGKLKLNHAVSPLENPLQLREKRRVVARLKTEWRARQMKEASSK